MVPPSVVNGYLQATDGDFLTRGFTRSGDIGDPWSLDWNLETSKFRLWIDCTYVVHLSHRNPDSDSIKVIVEDLMDLDNLLMFIADAEPGE